MYGSLFWIEWLDRLDRVLTNARREVATLTRAISPRSLEAIERSKRQLSALTNDLRLLDHDVLAAGPAGAGHGVADNLQKALDATVLQLGKLTQQLPESAPAYRDMMLTAVDSSLRDSCYEAAMLLTPSRRRAPQTAGLDAR
jgi:hypothetical protein